jgi:hypothetical protein
VNEKIIATLLELSPFHEKEALASLACRALRAGVPTQRALFDVPIEFKRLRYRHSQQISARLAHICLNGPIGIQKAFVTPPEGDETLAVLSERSTRTCDTHRKCVIILPPLNSACDSAQAVWCTLI